jgi:hypothetical protein
MTMVQILSPKKESAGKGGRTRKAGKAEDAKPARKTAKVAVAAGAPRNDESGK